MYLENEKAAAEQTASDLQTEQPGGGLNSQNSSGRPAGQVRPVRCMLTGSDTATAHGVTAVGRSPIFDLCRLLLSEDVDSNARLECFRGDMLCLTVKTIGIGAKLTIREDDRRGPTVVRWKAFSRADV